MSLRLGRILGFQVILDASWFVVFGLVAWSLSVSYFPSATPNYAPGAYLVLGLLASGLLFASVLAHELAHCLVAERRGLKTEAITLFLLGGVARTDGVPRTWSEELRITGIGPAVSVALGLGAGLLAATGAWVGLDRPWVALLQYLAIVNLMLGLFNLVPAYPMDGGRLLRAIVWRFTGSLLLATRIASWTGQGLGLLLAAYGAALAFGGSAGSGVWLLLLGWFITAAARAAYAEALVREALAGVPVSALVRNEGDTIEATTTLQELAANRLAGGPVFVLEEGLPAGQISAEAAAVVPVEEWKATRVRQVMTTLPEGMTTCGDQQAWDVLVQMTRSGRRRLMVEKGGRVVGTVTAESILQAAQERVQSGVLTHRKERMPGARTRPSPRPLPQPRAAHGGPGPEA